MHVEIVQNAKKDKGLYRNITKVNILYNKSDFYTIISLNFRLGDVRMKFKEFEYLLQTPGIFFLQVLKHNLHLFFQKAEFLIPFPN